jgi:hypothetical protein
LYGAIDRDGNLIDTMLSATRDMKAAQVVPLGTISCRFRARPGDNRDEHAGQRDLALIATVRTHRRRPRYQCRDPQRASTL